MPRIDAPTVAEHRDLQLARLLDAALDIVATHDVGQLTLAELAKRTGRSRASLYAYFGSTDAMRAAVCTHALTAWVDDLLADIRRASTPSDRLERFITAQIDRNDDSSLDRVHAFAMAQSSESVRTRVQAVTEPLTAELLAIIEGLGVEPPSRAATVVQGAVAAAHDQVRAGAHPQAVAEDTIAFVQAGLAALRRTGARSGGAGSPAGAAGRSAPAHSAPNTLAMHVSPSLPATFAIALAAAEAGPPAPQRRGRPSRAPVVRVASAQLAWAAAGFVSGITGVGGSALHIVLGVSLVAILAWAARVLGPVRLAPFGVRAMIVLAVAASTVAVVARGQEFDAAVATHIALATILLAGLAWIAHGAWRSTRAVPTASHMV